MELLPGAQVVLDIHADQYWNDTGVTLTVGATYDLRVVPAESRWTDGRGLLKYSSSADGRNYWPLWIFSFMKRYKKAEWFALVGARGKEEGDFFLIGKRLLNLKPEKTFKLFCFANDAKSKYGNNSGILKLQVHRRI